MLRGRAITASDRAESPRVAVVSDAFVRRILRGADPIGKRIRLGQSRADADWLTIVGVMPTLYAASPTSANGNHYPPEVLTAFTQADEPTATIALRGAAANAATLRRTVATLDPDVPVYATAMMDELFAQSSWPVRVFGTMFVIFGIASLVLAAIGLYAVMAFSVSRRVREMGIRLALGATRGAVIRLVCRQGATQVVLGMTIGLVLGTGLVRMVRMLLFEVRPADPTVFTLVVGVLAGAAFVACLIPAIGATRVAPVVSLRSE
jgi:ABC-type antimicrobial peptide transport system permease subunit